MILYCGFHSSLYYVALNVHGYTVLVIPENKVPPPPTVSVVQNTENSNSVTKRTPRASELNRRNDGRSEWTQVNLFTFSGVKSTVAIETSLLLILYSTLTLLIPPPKKKESVCYCTVSRSENAHFLVCFAGTVFGDYNIH